jgi:hypothetical protein
MRDARAAGAARKSNTSSRSVAEAATSTDNNKPVWCDVWMAGGWRRFG